MKTCKTCKFWGNPDLPKYMSLHLVCTHEKLAEDMGDNRSSDALLYPYNEGGAFFAGPDFGCIHHEEEE